MTSAKLRALFSAGLTYDEIAIINERSEGWRPARSTVLAKYREMGMPPRRPGSQDLIPWHIAPEHNNSIIRHMLQAESRSRRHKALSDTDRRLVARLHELLFGRGTLMVVDYNPAIGFAIVPREESDADIVRAPRDPDLLRKELATAMRDATNAELAQMALQQGIRPELLENAGRDKAADLLRKLLPASETHLQDEHVEAERPKTRRRAG